MQRRFVDKIIIKKCSVLILISIVALYICVRVFQGLPYLSSYLENIIYIIRFGSGVSYDTRMEKMLGRSYLLTEQIRNLTPENSVICFWLNDYTIDPTHAAYFWYPRRIEIVADLGPSTPESLRQKGCNYLLMDNGLPDFDLPVVKIVLLNETSSGESVSINTTDYNYKAIRYKGKIGILQL